MSLDFNWNWTKISLDDFRRPLCYDRVTEVSSIHKSQLSNDDRVEKVHAMQSWSFIEQKHAWISDIDAPEKEYRLFTIWLFLFIV